MIFRWSNALNDVSIPNYRSLLGTWLSRPRYGYDALLDQLPNVVVSHLSQSTHRVSAAGL